MNKPIKNRAIAYWRIISLAFGLTCATVSLLSLVAHLFVIELDVTETWVVSNYRELVSRIAYLTFESWLPVRIPTWLQDYIVLHLTIAVADIRMRSQTRHWESNVEMLAQYAATIFLGPLRILSWLKLYQESRKNIRKLNELAKTDTSQKGWQIRISRELKKIPHVDRMLPDTKSVTRDAEYHKRLLRERVILLMLPPIVTFGVILKSIITS